MSLAPPPLPYDEVANKIGMSLIVGLMVGFEREWAHKEVGVRTFAIIALLGTVASLSGTPIVMGSFCGVLLCALLVNLQTLWRDRTLELTTSTALLLMYVLGVVVGEGHFFTAATAAILLTMLLAWKVELASFAGALQPGEIRGAVLLGLLTFVILPLLPNNFVDPFELINLRQAWITIVAVAGIGFVNYVLLRLYSTKGLYYAALLGGLVNSTATVVELSAAIRTQGERVVQRHAESIMLLTNIAMFLRNVVLLGLFSGQAIAYAIAPLGTMALANTLIAYRDRETATTPAPALKLGSPVSLSRILKFGCIFISLAAAGTLAQRTFGSFGFLAVAVLGGAVSSASTVATAGSLVVSGQISPETAGIASVLTGVASSLINLPLVWQETRNVELTRKLTAITVGIACLGLLVVGSSYCALHGLHLP